MLKLKNTEEIGRAAAQTGELSIIEIGRHFRAVFENRERRINPAFFLFLLNERK